MKIKIVCVGNLKEKYLRDAQAEYIKRLGRFSEVNIIEIKENTNKTDSENLKSEAFEISKHLSGFVVALCIEGKQVSSPELSDIFQKVFIEKGSIITFVIGSSCGLEESIKKKADLQLSFSKMTFPHQLARVMLLEQIYRAFTISSNIKYHK